MTPSPFEGWTRSSVHGDGATVFSFEHNSAGVERPGGFALLAGIFVLQGEHPNRQQLKGLSIVGQGSRRRIQVRRLFAGAGIAIRFDALRRRFRLKPSFKWTFPPDCWCAGAA